MGTVNFTRDVLRNIYNVKMWQNETGVFYEYEVLWRKKQNNEKINLRVNYFSVVTNQPKVESRVEFTLQKVKMFGRYFSTFKINFPALGNKFW